MSSYCQLCVSGAVRLSVSNSAVWEWVTGLSWQQYLLVGGHKNGRKFTAFRVHFTLLQLKNEKRKAVNTNRREKNVLLGRDFKRRKKIKEIKEATIILLIFPKPIQAVVSVMPSSVSEGCSLPALVLLQPLYRHSLARAVS